MKVVKPKNSGVTILTVSEKELKSSNIPDAKDVTIRKLKSRKDTYRAWLDSKFSGYISVK